MCIAIIFGGCVCVLWNFINVSSHQKCLMYILWHTAGFKPILDQVQTSKLYCVKCNFSFCSSDNGLCSRIHFSLTCYCWVRTVLHICKSSCCFIRNYYLGDLFNTKAWFFCCHEPGPLTCMSDYWNTTRAVTLSALYTNTGVYLPCGNCDDSSTGQRAKKWDILFSDRDS